MRDGNAAASLRDVGGQKPYERREQFERGQISRHQVRAGGHTASNAPDLFRPPKLSGTGPDQYWARDRLGSLQSVVNFCSFFFLAKHIALAPLACASLYTRQGPQEKDAELNKCACRESTPGRKHGGLV